MKLCMNDLGMEHCISACRMSFWRYMASHKLSLKHVYRGGVLRLVLFVLHKVNWSQTELIRDRRLY